MAATVQASGFWQHQTSLAVRYYVLVNGVGYFFNVANVKRAVIAVNGGTPACAPANLTRASSFNWDESVNASKNIDLETANVYGNDIVLRLLAALYRVANPMNTSLTVNYVDFGPTSVHQVSFGGHKPQSFQNSIGTNLSVTLDRSYPMMASALVGAFAPVCGNAQTETLAMILLSLTKAGERQMFAETRNSDLFTASGDGSLDTLKASAVPLYYRFKGALVVLMDGVYDLIDRGASDSYFTSQDTPIELRPATACPLINPDNEKLYLTDNLISAADFGRIVSLNRASPGVREVMCNIRSVGSGRTRTQFLTDLIAGGAGVSHFFTAGPKMAWATAVKSVRVGLTYSSEDPRDLTLLIELSKLEQEPETDKIRGEGVFSFYVLPYVRTYDHGKSHSIYNRVLAQQREKGMEWRTGPGAGISMVLSSAVGWGDWGALRIDERRKAYLMWAAANLLSDPRDNRKWRKEPMHTNVGGALPFSHLRPNYNVVSTPLEISLDRAECVSDPKNVFNDQSNMCMPKEWWADARQQRRAWTTSITNMQASVIISHELQSGAAKYTGIMTKRGECMNLLNPDLTTENAVPSEYFEYMKQAMNLVSNPNVGIMLCGVEVPQEEVQRSVTNIIKVEGPSASFGATSGVDSSSGGSAGSSSGSSAAAGPTFVEEQLSRQDLTGIDVTQQSITEDAKSQFTQGMAQLQQKQDEPVTDPFTLAVGTKAKCESDPAFKWVEDRCQPKTSEAQCPADLVGGFMPGLVAKYDEDLRACHTQVMFGMNPDFIGAALVVAGVGAVMLGGKK